MIKRIHEFTAPIILMGAVFLTLMSVFGQARVSDRLVATKKELISLEATLKVAQAREQAMVQLNSRILDELEELLQTKTTTVEFSKNGAITSRRIPVGATIHVISSDEKLVAVRVADGSTDEPVEVTQ